MLSILGEQDLGLGFPDLAFYVESIDYEVYFPARKVQVS